MPLLSLLLLLLLVFKIDNVVFLMNEAREGRTLWKFWAMETELEVERAMS